MDATVPSSIDAANGVVRFVAVAANVWIGFELHALLRRRGVGRPGLWAAAALAPALALTLIGDLFQIQRWSLGSVSRTPNVWRFCSAAWAVGASGAFVVHLTLAAWRRVRRSVSAAPAPPERASGRITRRAALTAPFAVAGYGVFVEREKYRLREIEMAIPNLADDLDGLRIGHVTDIHAGPFLETTDVRRAVAMVNEAKPHLAMITGDLITRPSDPLHGTIDALAELRADSGVWGCMGNHERYARCRGETQVYGRRKGIEFLRQEARDLRFGDAELNLVGVDYQIFNKPYLIGAERAIRPGVFNLLLSHNPDVFPKAAELGFDLVLSGHTHGGQITIEILEQTVNPGRFLTDYVSGQYRIGGSSIYVSRGLGTVTLPMRLGAEPEVALITLRKA